MITATQRDAILDALIDTGAPYDPAGVYVGVFKDIVDHGVLTVMGDLTMPATSLAVRKAVTTFGTPYTRSNGQRVVDGPLMNFRPSSSSDADTVRGWFLADAASAGNLLAFGYLNGQPITLGDENTAVDVVLRVVVDPTGTWDATVSFNG